jgi:hypothetical protein
MKNAFAVAVFALVLAGVGCSPEESDSSPSATVSPVVPAPGTATAGSVATAVAGSSSMIPTGSGLNTPASGSSTPPAGSSSPPPPNPEGSGPKPAAQPPAAMGTSPAAAGAPAPAAAGAPAPVVMSSGGTTPADKFCDKYGMHCGYAKSMRHADRAACMADFNATPIQQGCKNMHLDTAIAGTAAACNGMPSEFCFSIHCLHAAGLPDPTGTLYCK